MPHRSGTEEQRKTDAIMVRVSPEMAAEVEAICRARARDKADLIRLYARKGLDADIARISRGEVLDDLGDPQTLTAAAPRREPTKRRA